MKKLLLFLAALVLVCIAPLALHASISVSFDGDDIYFTGQPPVNVDGRILVPARGVFEALGFTPSWDEELRQATLASADYIIIITIDSQIFTTNGQNHIFDVPAQIINNSTMIPLRAVLESIGFTPGWDPETDTVIITSGEHSEAHVITGIWYWMGTPFYNFLANGTGIRGLADEQYNFTWQIGDGHLTITTPSVTEEWNYEIDNDLLIITSRQVYGFSFIYTRQGGVSINDMPVPQIAANGDSTIVGAWSFMGLPYFLFYADGTGIRGAMGVYNHFRWRTEGGVLYKSGIGFVEEWNYMLDGNRLTLNSERLNMSFEYVRQ